MNDTLERTLEYCDKTSESFLNTTTNCSIPNVSISTVNVPMGVPSNLKAISNQIEERKSHIHFNRLWSVWYGILVTIFQGFLIHQGLQKYLGELCFVHFISNRTEKRK